MRTALEESARLLGERKPDEALSAAERALRAAGTKDVAGRAHAHRQRARCFEASDRDSEARAAWRHAAEAWQRLGVRPEQAEAWCADALLADPGDSTGTRESIDRAVSLARQERARPLAAISVLNTAGDRLWRMNRLDAADRIASAALALAGKSAPGSLAEAASLSNLGSVAWLRSDLDAARSAHERALTIREKLAAGSMDVARSLNNLGNVESARGDLDAAGRHYEKTLAILEQLRPHSAGVAGLLNNLGNLEDARGKLDAAQQYHQRALALLQEIAPDSRDVAMSLNNLGNTTKNMGDLQGAQDYYDRARATFEKLSPGSLELASCINNLGQVALQRGDLATARDRYETALAMREGIAPGSLDVAGSLNNLGNLALARGDLDAARELHQRARAIREERAPGSIEVATSLSNLGEVARRRGDPAAAWECGERALRIYEALAPGSMEVALSLNNLGEIARERGDLETARDYHQRGLAIDEKVAPGSIDVAIDLNGLGAVAAARNELDAARDYHERARAIFEVLAPASMPFAHGLHGLGVVARRQGDLTSAEQHQARAWSLVRAQRRMVIGDEAGRAFAAGNAEIVAELVATRLARGDIAAAFQALEEGRAQGLLQTLSERGLGTAGVDPEAWRRYEIADRAFAAAGRELADAGAEEARQAREAADAPASSKADTARQQTRERELGQARARREQAQNAYTRARVEQERLLGEVRRSVPGLEPVSFTPDEARRALPPGSAFLAWLVGPAQGTVFVISSDPRRPLGAYPIAIGEAELARRVRQLREHIAALEPAASSSQLVTTSRSLFDALFPPEARAAVEGSERVILSPDGPLWELPFAALAMKGSGKWLGLEKPLSYTASLSVLSLRRGRARGEAPTGGVLVMGDPVVASARASNAAPAAAPSSATTAATATAPSPATAATTAGSPATRGERYLMLTEDPSPVRLPGSADEARQIAAFYHVEPLLGEAADEKAVRARIGNAAVVHLATHGYFNPHLAMASGLLMSVAANDSGPEQTDNDGVLQAWEFGPRLQLKADVVVLSACETGRGENVRAEGVVGLTRAIEGAGARSVVATQWKVADRSTAVLMGSLHEQLVRGVSIDDALRRAQASTAARAETRHPFFWAAFFVTGEPDGRLSTAAIPARR
ncbi:MAG TPA: tetratricopeptide repeat protein [Candidatus Eisenbacteria bacterium]|nr:tetratricopeptide repeat protein [Candidatus Eisenbacteria bacterium]